jgi:hypothetical protein
MLGAPGPEATQGDQRAPVGAGSEGVWASLETLAAQGELSEQDAPSVRMLTLRQENHARQARAEARGFSRSKERTGLCTTAWVVKGGERPRCVSDSGRAHAGAHRAARVEQGAAAHGQPVGMSDALSRHEVEDTTVSRCPGLAQGRRQCSALADVFPVACQGVIEVLKHVFDHDAQARAERRSSQARLASHQKESGWLMDERQRGLHQPVEARLGAPNRA